MGKKRVIQAYCIKSGRQSIPETFKRGIAVKDKQTFQKTELNVMELKSRLGQSTVC